MLGLQHLWLLWYFIYIYAFEMCQGVAWIVGLIGGFAHSNWVDVFTNVRDQLVQSFIWDFLA